jgi:hypothetical protein
VHDQEDIQMEDGEIPTTTHPSSTVGAYQGLLGNTPWCKLDASYKRKTGHSKTGRLQWFCATKTTTIGHYQHGRAGSSSGHSKCPRKQTGIDTHACICKGHQNIPREARSPVQNTAPLKWKTSEWVPTEAQPPVKGGNKNTPAGVNAVAVIRTVRSLKLQGIDFYTVIYGSNLFIHTHPDSRRI